MWNVFEFETKIQFNENKADGDQALTAEHKYDQM